MKLKCKNYGLLTNTEVENEDGRILVTNGLSIGDLVDLWRWYYNAPFFKRIEVEVSEEIYNSIKQKTATAFKSVEQLFYERNVVFVRKQNGT